MFQLVLIHQNDEKVYHILKAWKELERTGAALSVYDAWQLDSDESLRAESVSYTHLDVYKRQVVALCDGKDIVWSTDPSASRRTGEKEPEPAATFETVPEVSADADYVLNTRSKKFHLPSCDSAKTIAVDNYSEFQGSREELIAEGYEPCGRCKP